MARNSANIIPKVHLISLQLYIEEKEQHLIREHERLKDGFKDASFKVERRAKEVIQKNEQKFQQRLKSLETEYNEKLNLLQLEQMK